MDSKRGCGCTAELWDASRCLEPCAARKVWHECIRCVHGMARHHPITAHLCCAHQPCALVCLKTTPPGVILTDREKMSPQKKKFAKDPALWASLLTSAGSSSSDSSSTDGTSAASSGGGDPGRDLATVVRAVQPTTLIGAAAVGGAFTPQVMAAVTAAAASGAANERVARAAAAAATASKKGSGLGVLLGGGWARQGQAQQPQQETQAQRGSRPVVLALSNPTSKAECTYAQVRMAAPGAPLHHLTSPFCVRWTLYLCLACPALLKTHVCTNAWPQLTAGLRVERWPGGVCQRHALPTPGPARGPGP